MHLQREMFCVLHWGRQNKQRRGNIEIKYDTYKSVGEYLKHFDTPSDDN